MLNARSAEAPTLKSGRTAWDAHKERLKSLLHALVVSQPDIDGSVVTALAVLTPEKATEGR